MLLLNVNYSEKALERLRVRLSQVNYKVVRGSLDGPSQLKPVVLQLESEVDALTTVVLLDGHRLDEASTPKEEKKDEEARVVRESDRKKIWSTEEHLNLRAVWMRV